MKTHFSTKPKLLQPDEVLLIFADKKTEGGGGAGRLRILPKVKQEVTGRAKTNAQLSHLQPEIFLFLSAAREPRAFDICVHSSRWMEAKQWKACYQDHVKTCECNWEVQPRAHSVVGILAVHTSHRGRVVSAGPQVLGRLRRKLAELQTEPEATSSSQITKQVPDKE